jgi:hypothetical protein
MTSAVRPLAVYIGDDLIGQLPVFFLIPCDLISRFTFLCRR